MTSCPKPKVIIVGGGIGGCTAAVALHKAGADVYVYEQASELKEIGAGINVQAVAIGALADLGISVESLNDPEDGDGILTSKVQYFTRDGIPIAAEATGLAAGADHPQFSSHRAKFHSALVAACKRCIGEDRFFLGHSFESLEKAESGVTVHFKSPSAKASLPPVQGDLVIGCDGLKSKVRAALLGHVAPSYTGRTIFRGICEVDSLIGDGTTVSLCGNYDKPGNFICYPISERLRKEGKTLCNWAFCGHRFADPGAEGTWTNKSSVDEIREELLTFEGCKFGGLTPLQIAERTESIIGWALFDRDPLSSFDFGNVTLLGDAAHPLLPFGSQGATQAIMDAEALGVAFAQAKDSTGNVSVQGVVKAYSDMRCDVSGKVVVANRGMGPTRVLQVVEEACKGMGRQDKEKWIQEHGAKQLTDVIQSYRKSMPKSVRVKPS